MEALWVRIGHFLNWMVNIIKLISIDICYTQICGPLNPLKKLNHPHMAHIHQASSVSGGTESVSGAGKLSPLRGWRPLEWLH